MTLILTFATPNYLLQVSDRLVTQGTKAFDPASNKNVIYHAKNAIVAIGYSGRAYMDGTATDRWIAEKLRGEKFRDHAPGEPYTVKMGRAERWLDIGQSIELLRRESAEVFCRLPASQRTRHHITIAGWQWQRRQDWLLPRPLLCEISNGESEAERHAFKCDQVPRYWHWARKYPIQLSWVPDWNPLSKGEIDQLLEKLRYTWPSPQASVNLLIGAIRFAAQKSPKVVGADCMGVYMPVLSSGVVHVRYLPADERERAFISDDKVRTKFRPTYSPWIIGPGLVAAPSIMMGSASASLGPVTVSIEGPDPSPISDSPSGSGGFTQAVFTKKRPLDPAGAASQSTKEFL